MLNDNVKPHLQNPSDNRVDNYFSSLSKTNQPQGYDLQQLSPLVCPKRVRVVMFLTVVLLPSFSKTHFPHVQPQAPSPSLSISHTNTLNTLPSSNLPMPESFITAPNEEVPKPYHF